MIGHDRSGADRFVSAGLACLDGLRAALALAEVLKLCGIASDDGAAMTAALVAFPQPLTPGQLIAGVEMDGMLTMLSSCIDAVARQQLLICHPFNGAEEAGDDAFRACLSDMLEATATVCALIQLRHPKGRWIIGRLVEGVPTLVDPYEVVSLAGTVSMAESGVVDGCWTASRDRIILFQHYDG